MYYSFLLLFSLFKNAIIIIMLKLINVLPQTSLPFGFFPDIFSDISKSVHINFFSDFF